MIARTVREMSDIDIWQDWVIPWCNCSQLQKFFLNSSISIYKNFIDDFPKSTYVDDSIEVIGRIYYKVGQFQKSIEHYFSIYDTIPTRQHDRDSLRFLID